MPTLLIRFPARRYHATPWGHHVNEGLIEWPPSPWRLLRSLVSVGYTSGVWNGNGPPAVAVSLLEKLASVLPEYSLPPAVGAHSRHYMPVGKLKDGREDTTLVFDTWARVSGELSVIWGVELNRDENVMLAALTERLGYLGRSESWIDARLLEPDETQPEAELCIPSDDPPPPGWEQVSLLAPQAGPDYAEWQKSAVEAATSAISANLNGKKKPTKKQLEKALEPYPPDLIACLQKDTSWWRKHGWSQPPGSRRVFYRRRVTALESGAPKPLSVGVSAPIVEAMLLSMSTQSGNDHALPPITRTLPQAELLHRAMVSHVNREARECPILTGCDEFKKPLQGKHEHAHVLPLDLDGDGHLDHVLVWASGGLDGYAQNVVRAIRRTYAKKLVEPLRLALVGLGDLPDLRRLPDKFGENLRAVLGPEEGARRWVSLTPFVAPRYLKKSGRNTLEGQIAAELASRGLPPPVEVKAPKPGDNPEFLRHRHFIRKRRKGAAPPADFGYSLELRFDEPVSGPICLGYGAHFGLGMFRCGDYCPPSSSERFEEKYAAMVTGKEKQ